MTSYTGKLQHRVARSKRQYDAMGRAMVRDDPQGFARRLELGEGVLEGAARWHDGPIVLPSGVELVQTVDDHGVPLFGLNWPELLSSPPPAGGFYDRAVAVELAWTAFRTRRPWLIDVGRLRDLVEAPPVPQARLLAELLVVRFSSMIREGLAAMLLALASGATSKQIEYLTKCQAAWEDLGKECRAKETLMVESLSVALDVVERTAPMSDELGRWQCMLHDYLDVMDPELHQHVTAAIRRHQAEVDRTTAWGQFEDCQRYGACLTLLLANAAVHDGRQLQQQGSLAGLGEPLAPRQPFSLARLCHEFAALYPEHGAFQEVRAYLERVDEASPICVDAIVQAASSNLARWDPPLHSALMRRFPSCDAAFAT